jgi:hypothetical protein
MEVMMKFKAIFYTLLALSLAVLASCSVSKQISIPDEYIASYLPDTSDFKEPEVKMGISFPDTPEKAIVFQIKYPEVTAQYAAEIAQKFDVSGEILEGEELFTVVDTVTKNIVEVWKTGAIWYDLESNAYMDVLFNDNAILPSTEEAKQIAINYLEERGLLTDKVKHYIDIGIGGGTTTRHETHYLVTFRYQIGDFQVEGPGFRYAVSIGDKGRVAGVSIFYPQFESYTEVELRTPQEAYNDLVSGKGSWMNCKGEKAIFDSVSLRYYLAAINEKQEYILPVYVFEGVSYGDDGPVGGRAGVLVTAVKSLSGQQVR